MCRKSGIIDTLEQQCLFSDIIINTSFYNIVRIESKYLRDFADEIKKDITVFLKLEED